MSPGDSTSVGTDWSRHAETVLRKFGYARIAPGRRAREPDATFWVQEAGVPRRTFPVFVPPSSPATLAEGIDRWLARGRGATADQRRAIFVASSDAAAEEAWERLARTDPTAVEHEVSILVVPSSTADEPPAHFALRRVRPAELLRVATGIVVGLFRRSHDDDAAGAIDFGEMLQMLRGRFGIDLHRSLGVRTDEDALYVLYQLAQRDAYAPGDSGSSLHLIVLKPTGPAARVPWFAA